MVEADKPVLGLRSAEVVAVHHTAGGSHQGFPHDRNLQRCGVQLVVTSNGGRADCIVGNMQLVVVAAVESPRLGRAVNSLRIGLLGDDPCPTVLC